MDYITIDRRYRNIRTHPEADCNSDHNMLFGDIQLGLQILKQKKSYFPKLDLKTLEIDKS